MRKFISTIILCLVSFIAGTTFNTLYIAEKTLSDINKLTELVIDPEMQIRRDVELYERSINEPQNISKALRFYILTRYDWSYHCRGEFCDELNLNASSYKSNQVIIDFLNKYSIEKCQSLTIKERVKCNLGLVP